MKKAKSKNKKLKHYVIKVCVLEEFNTLKDVEAYTEDEAFKKAEKLAKKEFGREIRSTENWVAMGNEFYGSSVVEDEYEV